ncbi:MAG: DUF2304 domain-containing protein [Clostridiales bacterium]|nr:DUF2304 domain-containing protein [Clostridiales bacterium]
MLRVLLIIAAVFTAYWILSRIRKHKVKLEDAIFWVCFAFVLVIIGIFPHILYWMSGIVGIMSPANLVFLVIIFLLIAKVFMLSIKNSQLEDKIEVLAAEVALAERAKEKEREQQNNQA